MHKELKKVCYYMWLYAVACALVAIWAFPWSKYVLTVLFIGRLAVVVRSSNAEKLQHNLLTLCTILVVKVCLELNPHWAYVNAGRLIQFQHPMAAVDKSQLGTYAEGSSTCKWTLDPFVFMVANPRPVAKEIAQGPYLSIGAQYLSYNKDFGYAVVALTAEGSVCVSPTGLATLSSLEQPEDLGRGQFVRRWAEPFLWPFEYATELAAHGRIKRLLELLPG